MNYKVFTIEELEDEIIDGNEEALMELSRRYREGDGVEINFEMAEKYEQMAAEIDSNEQAERERKETPDADTEGDDKEPLVMESDEDSAKELSWSEQYDEAKGLISSVLRQKAREGNSAASVVLAEKYLVSPNTSERDEGLRILEEAEKLLRKELSGGDTPGAKEGLVFLFNKKGEYLEQEYRTTSDPSLPGKIYEAYSNAHEIDPGQTAGLARCYRQGLGVEKNDYKANDYEEQEAYSGGIEKRYLVGINAKERGQNIKAAEWLQSALLADNAEEYPTLIHLARYLLADLNAEDERGRPVNGQKELEQLNALASSNDAEAAFYLADIKNSKEEKMRCYELGINGYPEDYALRCRQKFEEIATELEYQRIERERVLEEKRLEEEKRAETERLRHEALIRERQERIRKLKLAAISIGAVIILLVSVGIIGKITKIIKDKREAEELAKMNIVLERSVDIDRNAYTYDRSGKKDLKLNNNTINVKLKTDNPKPNRITEKDWESLKNNYKVIYSVPKETMKNGIEFSVTTEPKNQKIIDAFHEKYGCSVVENKETYKFKTDGFTDNITNGADFNELKGNVLKEMKSECVKHAKQEEEGSIIEETSVLNSYFLCPTPQENGYQNAKIVIAVRVMVNTGMSPSFTDYIYLFPGPFDKNYNKNEVNINQEDWFKESELFNEPDYDLKYKVLDYLRENDENESDINYDWQKMD